MYGATLNFTSAVHAALQHHVVTCRARSALVDDFDDADDDDVVVGGEVGDDVDDSR